MSKVGDQEVPKWVAYNYRDELVRAMTQIDELTAEMKHHNEMSRCWKANAESLADVANELQAIVDAAIVYVHAVNMAHHGPYSQQQAKAHRNLIDEVVAYEENQQ